jgi:hypothetical protein
MKVSKLFHLSILLSWVALAAALLAGTGRTAQTNSQAQPLSDDEIRARTKTLLANQHADDQALELYERVERHILRTGGANPRTVDDKTYRVIPTGVGNQKILLHEEGKATDPAAYARQMQILEALLESVTNPNDPRGRTASAKFDKRMRERAQFVDAASQAYIVKSVGRENRDGHDCDVVELNPDPKFQPRSIFQDAFAHTTAKFWVDHQATQLVYAEAHVTSDVAFGAGILGKLYRGSVVALSQAEIAPAIWLPTRYQYDYAGRKFLFSFDQHEIIEASRYRRIGPPKEALQTLQNELLSGKTFSEDR